MSEAITSLRRGAAASPAAAGRRKKEPDTTAPAGDSEWFVQPVEEQGPRVRRSARAAKRGWYAPRADSAPTTTRQAEVLNTSLIAAPLDERGILIGRDRLSSAPVAHDPFTAYNTPGGITSPSVLVLGAIGSGKSSLLKTVYALRPLMLQRRRVVVYDRKDQGGAGEYDQLTRWFNRRGPLRFSLDGQGTILNPFDPRILDMLGVGGQYRLLKSIADRANGGRELDPQWEGKALRDAHRRALARAEERGRVAVLEDLIVSLGVVDVSSQEYSLAARERLHQAGLGVRFLFETLADDLHGMFDDETSKDVELNARLTTFDLSQLPQEGPAAAIVMAIAHSWLLGTMRGERQRGIRTNLIAEEGWDLVAGPIAKNMKANLLLARGLGLSTVTALHHISQIPADSDAMSMVREPQTVHIYRQDKDDDIRQCADTFDLDDETAALLGSLGQGDHLLKIGSAAPIRVDHVRSSIERQLTDTDGAMKGVTK
jgi:hypothetical protein